jgi:hypothetical protein
VKVGRREGYEFNRRTNMLYTVAVVLVVLWLLGFFIFPVAGGLIHLLLVLALIAIVYQLMTGRKLVR